MQVVIDSSVLVALLNPTDVFHQRALNLHDALLSQKAILFYFDVIAMEAISVVSRRLREKKHTDRVMELLKRFEDQFPRDLIIWILADIEALYDEALELVKSSLGELNFNDALIALSCRDRDITYLASFDSDFDQIPWLKRVAAPADVVLNNGQEQ